MEILGCGSLKPNLSTQFLTGIQKMVRRILVLQLSSMSGFPDALGSLVILA
jgi:hypothetical protein